MAEKKCFKHSNQDAIALCYQCHKPICNACISVTEFGNFCSNECNLKYKEFKLKFQKDSVKSKKGGILKTLIILMLLAILILTVITILAKYSGVEALSKFDILELLFGGGSK